MAKYLGIPLQVASGTTVTPTYGSSELVVDGDFPAGTTAWDFLGGASLETNGAKIDNGGTSDNAYIRQTFPQSLDELTGKKFELTYDVVATDGSILQVEGTGSSIDLNTATIGQNRKLVYTWTKDLPQLIIKRKSGVTNVTIDNVSLKEIPYVLGKEIVSSDYIPANFTTGSGWTLNGSSASRGVVTNAVNYLVPNITSQLVDGKSYQVGFTLSNMSQTNTAGISSTGAFGQNGADLKFRATNGSNLFNSVYDEDQSLSPDLRFVSGTNALTFTVSGITVKEAQYNYLQVAGGDFLKQCKVGDVVFNYTDDNEAVVVQVIDNDTLLLSNDVLSDAGDSFSIFAPNSDTRGNQILRVDNYIISEYDEATSLPNKSSFWFAAGPQADKVTLQQLNNAINTYFVADVIERFIQRLNAQSATASRLDIPLNEFRDHKYNQVLTTTAITLS